MPAKNKSLSLHLAYFEKEQTKFVRTYFLYAEIKPYPLLIINYLHYIPYAINNINTK